MPLWSCAFLHPQNQSHTRARYEAKVHEEKKSKEVERSLLLEKRKTILFSFQVVLLSGKSICFLKRRKERRKRDHLVGGSTDVTGRNSNFMEYCPRDYYSHLAGREETRFVMTCSLQQPKQKWPWGFMPIGRDSLIIGVLPVAYSFRHPNICRGSCVVCSNGKARFPAASLLLNWRHCYITRTDPQQIGYLDTRIILITFSDRKMPYGF